MKQHFLNKFLVTKIFSIILLFGCVDLKKINDFSAKSSVGLKKFEEVGYSFVKSCQNKCQLEQLQNQQLFQKNCDCSNDKAADSVTLILYNSVSGYLNSLTKLSDNDLTTYKFDALNKALTAGKFGDVIISKEHVESYSKISAIMLKAFTDSYRKKKLSKYIGEANQDIKRLIDALSLNVSGNLTGKVNVEIERYRSYYFDLLKDSNASGYEKKKIIEEYNNTLFALENKKNQINSLNNILKGIAKGHQQLYEDRNKLTAKALKGALMQYSSDLQDIINEFNKLKNAQ